MDDSNVRIQADNFHLPRSVSVVGLVAVAVLAVEVLGDGWGSEVDSTTKLDKLFPLSAAFHDAHIVQDDMLLFRRLELLLLSQTLVVGDRVDAVGKSSRAPPVQFLVVYRFGGFDQVLQDLHVELLDERRDCDDTFGLGLLILSRIRLYFIGKAAKYFDKHFLALFVRLFSTGLCNF